jgi:superfamily II DNA/RNA helicase
MSTITIKRHNHLLYHSMPDRHNEMLIRLLSDHHGKNIIIAVSTTSDAIPSELPENVRVVDDETVMAADDLACEVMIHLDLPQKALHYIKRLSCVKEMSLGLLLPEQTGLLYPIETLLGRNIMQKHLEGFEPVQEEAPEERAEAAAEQKKKYVEKRSRDDRQRDTRPGDKKKSFGKPAHPEKRRQRNHHKDGTVRTDEEREAYQKRRTESGQKRKAFNDKQSENQRNQRERADKKFDKKEHSDNDRKEKKPFNKGDKKPYGKKPFDKKRDDGKKPYGKKPGGHGKRNDDRNPSAEPKRKPRNFGVKSLKKPDKES